MTDAPDDDEPLTLKEACELIFRNTIKPATLLAEAERGRLVIEKIGRRSYVTRAGIKRMRKLCEVRHEPPRAAEPAQDEAKVALDAALLAVEKLGQDADAKRAAERKARVREEMKRRS